MMNWTILYRDKLFLGAFAGIISDLIMNVFESIIHGIGLTQFTLDDFAGGMFIKKGAVITPITWWLLGFLAGLALCILLGIIFVYIVEWTGSDGIVFKGTLYGFLLWFLIYGGIKSGLEISSLQDHTTRQMVIQILPHLVFGASLGIIVKMTGYRNRKYDNK